MRKFFSTVAVAAFSVAFSFAANAAYPDKTIKLIVPFATGTSTDALARDLGRAMAKISDQVVVVENRPGAEGTIGGTALARAEPDGYTVMLTSSSVAVLDPLLRKKPIIQPTKDFRPVCGVARIGLGLYIQNDLPFKTLSDFIAAAKAEPDRYTFGYASATGRLAGELLQQQAGIKLRGIPYKSTSAAINDVAGGQIDMIINDPMGTAALYAAGKIRPLVVAYNERLAALPDVPSAVEAGLPEFVMVPWFGVFLPASAPDDVTTRLRDIVKQAMATPEQVAMRKAAGMEEFSLCEGELKNVQETEMDRWRKVVSASGIELQ